MSASWIKFAAGKTVVLAGLAGIGLWALASDPEETARKLLLKRVTATLSDEHRPQPEMSEEERLSQIMRRAGIYMDQRRFAEAGEVLREAEALKPNDPGVRALRMVILAELGKLEEARAINRELLKEHPGNFVYRYNEAELYMMERRYGEARRRFEKLREAHPDNDLLVFKIFLTYLGEKNEKMMLEWARKLDRPTDTPYMYYAASALALFSGDIATGHRAILDADRAFGYGKQRILYHSLAQMGLVIRTAYPPGNSSD